MKKVLILTAGFGEGHNAAARNIAAALRESSDCAEVRIVDPFEDAYPRINAWSQWAYQVTINRLPHLWRAVFRLLDKTNLLGARIRTLKRAAHRLDVLLDTFHPDVVVTTYPGYNHLLNSMFSGGRERRFRVFTMVTDSITINSVWHTGLSDYFMVPNKSTALILRRAGVDGNRISVTGFPVPLEFVTLRENAAEPPAGGEPWRVLFLINSGRRAARAMAGRLLRLEGVEPVFAAGRDEVLRRRLLEMVAAAGRTCLVHGWAPDLPALMASCHLIIGKAGGATVQECMAVGRPLIITQIVPGQEEGNARLVLENDAGCLARGTKAVGKAIVECTADGGTLWRDWNAGALDLGSPNGALRVARFVLEHAEGNAARGS